VTVLRLTFAGEIKRADIKSAGPKTVAEVSLCRKNYAKEGQPETFTWVRVSIWEPADWMLAKLVKGAFIAGSGEMSARSYQKDGADKTSIEIRCTGYDVELPREAHSQDREPPKPEPRRPAPGGGDDEPPFMRSELEGSI
jgi:hypothetical protein